MAFDRGARHRQKRSGERASPWNNPLLNVMGKAMVLPSLLLSTVFVDHLGMVRLIKSWIHWGALIALNESLISSCGTRSYTFWKSIQQTARFLSFALASCPIIVSTARASRHPLDHFLIAICSSGSAPTCLPLSVKEIASVPVSAL